MEKFSSVTAALDAGKIPSTEQLNAIIDWFTQVAIPVVQPAEDSLSGQGRVLAKDVRNVLDAYKSLNLNKNKDDLLQEAIWHLTEGEITTTVDSAADVVDQKQLSSDVDAVRRSLRTILSIVWQSVSSEGGFLLNDFASFARLSLADAAEAIQDQAGRAASGLRDVEQGVQDGQRDNLGRDKKRLEEEKDVRVAFETRHGHAERRWLECHRRGSISQRDDRGPLGAHQLPPPSRLLQGPANVLKKTQPTAPRSPPSSTPCTSGSTRRSTPPTDQSFTAEQLHRGHHPEQHVHKALNALKTLVDRFAKPDSSVDAILLRAQALYQRRARGLGEVKAWVDKFFAARAKESGGPRVPALRGGEERAARLAPQREDADRHEHGGGAQVGGVEGRGEAVWGGVAADEDVERLRVAHVRLGEDVENGLVEAGEEAETGVQAVLERAAWFWRDLFAVYAPRVLGMLQGTCPFRGRSTPTTTSTSCSRTSTFRPLGSTRAHLRAQHHRRRRAHLRDRARRHRRRTFTHIRLQAVQLALEDVSFYYKDKTSTLPPNEFTGLLALKMPPQGIDVDIKLLTVEISDNVEVDVRESNHAIVLAVFKPIFNMRFREALGRALGEQLRAGLDWLDHVAWDVGKRAEVFGDAGVGRGAALRGLWSEIGRIGRESTAGWRATGTGVVIEDSASGGAKFAIGAEPQVLSGEKRGPVGTGSESLEKRVGEAVDAVAGQTGVGEAGDVKQAVKEGAKDASAQLQGMLREGKRQVRSFRRSVEDKSVEEKKNPGWKSQAFDI
ncbi:hypothetical protein B0H16DRAFT_1899274 [Mycena metata]|uniref:Uncharacterized protein n=1 Tax=Mycena metata TaxID=1033252 RepID=A0AAD7H771_9AGAR|nr:hypothetical protein B0H16DRAFT_1899274 [Mycena metata]